MQNIKKLILKHDVISFDIFDTLLTRPYINPYDLLKHVEKYTNRTGFAENRYNAECNARCISSKEDITFDEIYKFVSEKYRDLKSVELDFEYNLLRPNNKVKEIYNFAKENNKRIYIISDMYLPKDFLEKILMKNGFTGYQQLYLSNEYGLAKYTGNLFKQFLSEQKIKANKVLHIGDSRISDIKKPKKLGIHTYQIKKNSDIFFAHRQNKRFKNLYKNNQNSLEISLILATLADKFVENKQLFKNCKYWENFGYYIAGIIAYGFARFILDKTFKANYQELLFVARDGFLLKKVVDMLLSSQNNIKTFYVYAQRILRARILLDYGDEHNANVLINIINEETGQKKSFNSFKEKENYIEKNRPILQDKANDKKEMYKNYLISNGIGINKNLVVIDTGAATFSAQSLLKETIGRDIEGLYSIITKPEYAREKQIKYQTWANNPNDIKNITAIIEFCLTSPELPVIDFIDSKPVYIKNPTKQEIYRNQLYDKIEKGVIEFTRDMKERLSEFEIEFSAPEVNKYINAFCSNLNNIDKKNLSTVFCSSNASHTEYKHNLLKLIINNCTTK